MTILGELALWVALFVALFGAAASFAGARKARPDLIASGVRAVAATAVMVVLASLGVWSALLSHDFALAYVAGHTTLNTPALYLLTAFWAGPAGAMLSLALALSAFATAAISAARRRDGAAVGWVSGTVCALLALILLAICFGTNPYDRIEWVPAEGRGLAPALQNPLAAPYFVASYAAVGAASVPLVLAVGALAARRFHAHWSGVLRLWPAVAWCLLTLALALRTRWAYVEPGLGDIGAAGPAQALRLALWLAGAVLIGWLARQDRRPSVGPARRGRAVGMYAVYAGSALVILGLVARRSWTRDVVILGPGQARELEDPFGRRWRFVSQGASRDERLNYLSTGVAVEAWRGGDNAGIISSERRQYLDSVQRPVSEPSVEPGIRSLLSLDVYVMLAEVRGDRAELRLSFRPLVACLWAGWALILAGAVVTTFRSATRSERPVAPA